MRIAIMIALAFFAAPAAAQEPIPIHADIGLPGPEGHFLVVSVRGGGIEGCITDAGRRCTRTRRVALTRRDRDELTRRLEAVRAMPRCEPVGFEEGDPPFTIRMGERTMRGHLPRALESVPARIDEPCEAEHALAWWIAQRFRAR